MKRRVLYLYDEEAGSFVYDRDHLMKPFRIKMTHNLIHAYGLLDKMRVMTPRRASANDMKRFHDPNYINFLHNATLENINKNKALAAQYSDQEDNPFFPGLFDFCQISAGGSIDAARHINEKDADIAINWAGGLHHAHKAKASGFCYVADCVLGILKLLERYNRVLYIDIDIHHGDGVEEAFYNTDRVMTVSFHKYGDFFPGTGNIRDIGYGPGKYYTINVPLKDGIDDESYHSVFKPIISHVIEWYRPEAIFFQSGADSLAGDKLGGFNLSIKGHGECLSYVKSFGIPMIVAGGGGYTVRNVIRCWTYETALLINEHLDDNIPYNDFYDYYIPDHNLHLDVPPQVNQNPPEILAGFITHFIDNLRHMPCAPSQMLNPKIIMESSSDEDEIIEPEIIEKYLSTKIVM